VDRPVAPSPRHLLKSWRRDGTPERREGEWTVVDTKRAMKIYLAGPLGFSEAGRSFYQREVVAKVGRLGHVALDPWSDVDILGIDPNLGVEIKATQELPYGPGKRDAWQALNVRIGAKNRALIDACDLVFAVLDGADVDSGTAAEVGYAFAKGKPILGYRGDFRVSADNEGAAINLQVEYFIRASGGTIMTRLDELEHALAKITPGRQ
jgi:nucleoside 2-deoxyribosyltransferase